MSAATCACGVLVPSVKRKSSKKWLANWKTRTPKRSASDDQAGEIARRHISDWATLVHKLEEVQRGKESAMTTWQHNAQDRDLRERDRLTLLAGGRRDMLYGLRVRAKNPGFTTVAVLTLAVCIGANTAIFSVISAVMFKSLPVCDPQRWHTLPAASRAVSRNLRQRASLILSVLQPNRH